MVRDRKHRGGGVGDAAPASSAGDQEPAKGIADELADLRLVTVMLNAALSRFEYALILACEAFDKALYQVELKVGGFTRERVAPVVRQLLLGRPTTGDPGPGPTSKDPGPAAGPSGGPA